MEKGLERLGEGRIEQMAVGRRWGRRDMVARFSG